MDKFGVIGDLAGKLPKGRKVPPRFSGLEMVQNRHFLKERTQGIGHLAKLRNLVKSNDLRAK